MDNLVKLKLVYNILLIWIEECLEVKYEGFKELIGCFCYFELKFYMICIINFVGIFNWMYWYFFWDECKKWFVFDDREFYEKRMIVKGDMYYYYFIVNDNFFFLKSYVKQFDGFKVYDFDLYWIVWKG